MTLTPGDIVTNAHALTSPIGDHFAPGSRFVVDLVGHSPE